MNSGFSSKSVAAVFLAALAFYVTGFYGLEYLRLRKGPWEIAFEPNPGGAPAILIQQPSAGITNVKVVFHGESATNPPAVVRFDDILKSPAFGEIIYQDPMFLPGVITFNLFGHELELMPRVLIVNRKETPWQPGSTIDLWPTNKPAQPLPSPKGNRPLRP